MGHKQKYIFSFCFKFIGEYVQIFVSPKRNISVTMSSLKYSVYGHVIVTLSVVYLLSLSMYHGMIDNESKDDNDQFRKKVDEWINIILLIQIFSIIIVPVVWFFEVFIHEYDSIHQLLHFNMQKESFLAVSQSGVMIWIQVFRRQIYFENNRKTFR
uniref:Serpentine receptor class gamma n=1 Tax=Caenorhabditis tropicalis TaxID=1561998 RepID=A0A1I7UWC4_9PELO